jgi:selenocysteine-specific translation elongation factor
MQVIATAGHVDHGKSTLLRALTGMDPDRWSEEKRRGLTIDLGFAWLKLPSGERIAFVDVPGHERFVPNMLAGLGPVPAVMFIVAADEGWMPQSAEHLAVVDALGIRSGLLVVTRSDLADPAPALAQATAEMSRSSLGVPPAVVVSAVTGDGLADLVSALDKLAQALPVPDQGGPVRLWVDRAFTMTGSGTVVTGTLPAGTVHRGDELVVTPSMRPVRVRDIQTLGESAAAATGVARVALNLRGVSKESLARGMAIVQSGRWTATDVVDVRIHGGLAEPDPASAADLAMRLPRTVTLHIGSAKTVARVRPLSGAIARLSLRDPLPLHVGDRILLRDPGVARTPRRRTDHWPEVAETPIAPGDGHASAEGAAAVGSVPAEGAAGVAVAEGTAAVPGVTPGARLVFAPAETAAPAVTASGTAEAPATPPAPPASGTAEAPAAPPASITSPPPGTSAASTAPATPAAPAASTTPATTGTTEATGVTETGEAAEAADAAGSVEAAGISDACDHDDALLHAPDTADTPDASGAPRPPARGGIAWPGIIGAVVLDVAPLPLTRRGAAAAAARELATWPDQPAAADLLRRHGLLRASALLAMGVHDHPEPVTGEWLADPSRWAALAAELGEVLASHAAREPLAPGLPLDAARAALGLPDRRLVAALARPPLRIAGGLVQLAPASAGPASAGLPESVAAAVRILLADLAQAPFSAPDAERLRKLGLDVRAIAAAARAGVLLRISDQIVLAPGADEKAAEILAALPQPFTAADARQALGTTRRTAIPLLEYLDRAGVTDRLPDDRRQLRPR